MSSYAFSEQHNFQTVLWAVAGAAWRMGGMARQTPQAALHGCLWLYTTLLALWPDVAALVGCTVKVTAVVAGIVGIVAGVALLMCNPMLLVGLTLTGCFALATRPKGARNG